MPVNLLEPIDPAKSTIVIVDDHPLLRRGLTALINFETNLVVCGEAVDYPTALEAVQTHRPDLVIVELELRNKEGLELVKTLKIRYPLIRLLVLTMHDESRYAERSLRAGAGGYITKQQLDETLLTAIRCVLAGEIYMSVQLQERLAMQCIGRQTQSPDSSPDSLSDRELQVFRLIGEGRGTRQIAEDLFLSIKTIESHRENIKSKLAIKTSGQLVQRAVLWL
jgi:DNA-binding NarL/FixJ family response regulator